MKERKYKLNVVTTSSVFASVIHTLAVFVMFQLICNSPFVETQKTNETYDFIVVGGGTGGSVVAGRLAETGLFNVLLIEAGGLPEPDWSVPALTFEKSKTGDSKDIKHYKSLPQRNAALENDGIIDYPTGRVLGGSSTISGMFINRGNPLDYYSWARFIDDGSWGYSNMLPYFKKFEKYTGDFPSDERGYDGPISVGRSKYTPELDSWLQAGLELGYPIADSNGPQKISFTPIDFSMKNGRRVSSYNGYIEPVLASNKRNNLRVLINSEVTKILFEGKRAVGVEYRTNSNGRITFGQAMARSEIIISAGVFGSPTLLMKSGIGPRGVLTALKIPVVSYLMAGRNLQNHLVVDVPVIVNRTTANIMDPVRDLTPATWSTYNRTGEGPYSSYGGFTGQAFVVSSTTSTNWKSGNTEGWPNIQLIFSNSPLTQPPGINREALESDIEDGEVAVSISTVVGRPQSRGKVTLDTSNMENNPEIDFRFLTHPTDMHVAVTGIKTIMKIIQTSAFRRLGARLPRKHLPACKNLELNSDEYWRCVVRETSHAAFHAVGTCRIGRDPSDGVVDNQLRVIGVKGLRVVDASVFPTLVNSNTQAAVYATAEKAADIIVKTWRASALTRDP